MHSQSSRATLVSFRSLTDCTVRLASGEEVQAVMDVSALRQRHGPIYNIRLGGPVEIEPDTPIIASSPSSNRSNHAPQSPGCRGILLS